MGEATATITSGSSSMFEQIVVFAAGELIDVIDPDALRARSRGDSER